MKRKYPQLRGSRPGIVNLSMFVANMPWFTDAACATTTDPDAWFPNPKDIDVTDMAVAICTGCPVREQCLAYAVEHGIEYGIWGGLTATERTRQRRDRTRRRGTGAVRTPR